MLEFTSLTGLEIELNPWIGLIELISECSIDYAGRHTRCD